MKNTRSAIWGATLFGAGTLFSCSGTSSNTLPGTKLINNTTYGASKDMGTSPETTGATPDTVNSGKISGTHQP